jgi:hypothetical protein
MLALLLVLKGCCDPRILTDTLPEGRVGQPYLIALESECGSGFWFVSGELPPGLSFTSEGVFVGTPLVAGLFFLTVTWEDRVDGVTSSVSKGFLLVILEAEASESVDGEHVFDLS